MNTRIGITESGKEIIQIYMKPVGKVPSVITVVDLTEDDALSKISDHPEMEEASKADDRSKSGNNNDKGETGCGVKPDTKSSSKVPLYVPHN